MKPISSMPIRHRFTVAAAAAALLVAGVATAGQAAGERAGHCHAGKHRMIERLDLGADGQLDRQAYLARVAERHAAMDSNGDGHVSFEEMQAWWAVQREQRARERFERRADGEAGISLEAMQTAAERRFARLDRDGDGVITADELRRPRHGHGRRGGAPAE
jgi:hypothetical protein